uniref:VIgL family C1q-related protein 4 isoform 1 n=1 Tax=Littorina littorea TaxID=31216 RepID=A0A411DEM7_LITLI|nr:VIgL family C1q-related protein 4 isoform 1 [Littorina littorea]
MFVMPAFSGRVRKISNAGIEIDGVQVLDTGNYSVRVVGGSAESDVVTLQRSVDVFISDGLQTTDEHQHVTQQPVAEYDNSTHQYHVVLRCGTFTYPTHPPFDVTWETPSGQTEQSSSYKDGSFLLKLPNPVEGGTYTCRLPLSAACLHGGTGEPTLTVAKMEARLAVLEARQEGENSELKSLVRDLQNNNSDLTTKYNALENQNSDLTTKYNALNRLLNQTVSFHARLAGDKYFLPSGSTLILPTVVNNHGNAYDNNTGKFTAPFTATYCFLATTVDLNRALYAELSLVVDGTEVDYVHTNTELYFQSASVHAVLHLTAGQKVWLNVPSSNNYFWARATAFSGFLVDHAQ